MLARSRSHTLALMTASVIGCGAPSPEDTTSGSSPAALTIPPTLGAVFERPTFAVVGAPGERDVTTGYFTDPSVSLAVAGPAGQVVQWGQMAALPGRGPELVPGVVNAVSVSTSPFESCAVLGNGSVWCWNGLGLMPAPVPGLTGVVSMAQSGTGANCAVRSDRTLWCWGRNGSGELGDGTRVTRATPARVDLGDVVQVSMAGNTTCARVGSGVAYCWGLNGSGQVGDGSMVTRLRPTVVPLFHVTSVQASPWHTCAVLGTGQVACWGLLWAPAIGPTHGGDRSVLVPSPAVVPGLTNVAAVAPGENHVCALTRAGEAWCWGQNRNSSLGNGPSHGMGQATPVRAAEGHVFTEIHAGASTTCGREPNGSVWCWGSNDGMAMGQPSTFTFSYQAYAVPGVR